MRPGAGAARLLAGGLIAQLAPAVTAIGPLRRGLSPRLSGVGPTPHIALTFDDGPDPDSTPAFLDLLARRERRATFFVLGSQARDNAALVSRMVTEGHEVAIHGWTHRCTATFPPTQLLSDLRDARDQVEDITGTAVRWYRPPYGVLTGESLLACRALALSPVLWTAWGREWERSATPPRITSSVLRTLRPGGTILLHDTASHSPRGDWRRTLAATDALLSGPLATFDVGLLRDHFVPADEIMVAPDQFAGASGTCNDNDNNRFAPSRACSPRTLAGTGQARDTVAFRGY